MTELEKIKSDLMIVTEILNKAALKEKESSTHFRDYDSGRASGFQNSAKLLKKVFFGEE